MIANMKTFKFSDEQIKNDVYKMAVSHMKDSMLFKSLVALKPSRLAIKCVQQAINEKVNKITEEYNAKYHNMNNDL